MDNVLRGGNTVKILTLLKYSLDVSEIKVDPTNHELRLGGVPQKIGNIDKNVVEAGVRLKESNGGTVLGLCFGPATARDSFRDILAMGVDEVTLIEDPSAGQSDTAFALKVLVAAINKLGPFDLILCGFASDDGYTYQVGPRLAERLGLPLVSYACKLILQEGQLLVNRDLDDQLQVVSVGFPALISIAEESFPPRRTTLMDALKAKKKPVNLWNLQEHLGIAVEEAGQAGELGILSQEGIVVHRKRQMVSGQSPAEAADHLIDALLQENILKGN
jgi:electron transfer flavoprotein alpha/beta subunit